MHIRYAVATVAALVVSSATQALAVPLILNGGFETGDFTDWTNNTETGSSGSFSVQTGTVGVDQLGPISNLSNVGPGSGVHFALSDQSGPGSYSLDNRS